MGLAAPDQQPLPQSIGSSPEYEKLGRSSYRTSNLYGSGSGNSYLNGYGYFNRYGYFNGYDYGYGNGDRYGYGNGYGYSAAAWETRQQWVSALAMPLIRQAQTFRP